MLLMIAQNPHTKEPNVLFNQLQGRIAEGVSTDTGSELDKEGVKRLKGILRKGKRIKVK